MAFVLLLEDNPNDIRTATELAREAGFTKVEAQMSPTLAAVRLGNAIEDCEPLPDVLILDLDLGVESGFELLRFVHANRLVSRLRVVVWTVMGEHEREICRLFGINEFVSKYDGPGALLEVLTRINHIQTGRRAPGLPASNRE